MLPRELRQSNASVETAAAAVVIKKDPELVTWSRDPGGATTTGCRRRRAEERVSVGIDLGRHIAVFQSPKGMGYIIDQ